MRRRLKIRGQEIHWRSYIPNMITSGNLLCGMLSLILTLKGQVYPAAWLIAFAVFFDFMDGKVARMLGVSSAFGVEFDSLGDVVSFGVAPAILVFSSSLSQIPGVWGALIAVFFALCGALRLARFNVVHMPGPFQGLPIPAAGLFLVSWIMARMSLSPYVMAVLVMFAGGLMISTVSYSNLKGLKRGMVDRRRMTFLKLLALVVAVTLRERALLVLLSIYIASGLIKFDWESWLSTEEVRAEADR